MNAVFEIFFYNNRVLVRLNGSGDEIIIIFMITVVFVAVVAVFVAITEQRLICIKRQNGVNVVNSRYLKVKSSSQTTDISK